MTLPRNSAEFARQWVEDWNSRDLDRILAHYADEVVFTSPIAARLMGLPNGTVHGKEALRSYFGRGLSAVPDLHFSLRAVTESVATVSLVYMNQAGRMVVEMMDLGADQKVIRAIVSYGDPIPPAPAAI